MCRGRHAARRETTETRLTCHAVEPTLPRGPRRRELYCGRRDGRVRRVNPHEEFSCWLSANLWVCGCPRHQLEWAKEHTAAIEEAATAVASMGAAFVAHR